MMDETAMAVPLDNIVHIIQVALTSVFLLFSMDALLSMITARLGRVANHSDASRGLLRDSGSVASILYPRLIRLRRRLRALDAARVLKARGGAAVCVGTCAVFLRGLQNATAVPALLRSLGLSALCTTAALIGFLVETLVLCRRKLPFVASLAEDP